MLKNCLLCGVGGQGVVLASKLIAFAAMKKGLFVRTTDTIGMAQRGGSVVSHVRIGEEIHSPIIPTHSADIILAFEPAEAVRTLPYLKEGGIVVVNKKAVKPVTATLTGSDYNGEEMLTYLKEQVQNLFVVDGDKICEAIGSAKVLNVALLGVLAQSDSLNINLDDIEAALEECVPKKFFEMNKEALYMGAQIMKDWGENECR